MVCTVEVSVEWYKEQEFCISYFICCILVSEFIFSSVFFLSAFALWSTSLSSQYIQS